MKMHIPAPPPSGPALEWVGSLLEQRQRDLADLDHKYSCQQIPEDEYLSCRRSLQQAASEIVGCLRQALSQAFVTTDSIKRIG